MKKIKIIEQVRAVKSKKELANIIKAQRISEKVLQHTVANLKTGVTEIQVARSIEKLFITYGAPILAFPVIVAFGKNTANIHHVPAKNKLKVGDIIMFDIGCTVNHYCSDMTRTYFWGEPNIKQKEMYKTVYDAQTLAMKAIQKGERRGKVIDSIARKFIAKKYPDNFKHGLGHGVGTVIHEWPFFSPHSAKSKVSTGTVMTVEPGVYLPGFGGVRIEDMLLITKTGYKNLTLIPSELSQVILQPK